MADFNVRSDAVDVDEIMKQIRTRIREKRGVDYTEADLQHLANIKMEQFLDPRKLRSDLVEQFKRQRAASPAAHTQEGAPAIETGNALKRFARKIVRRIVRSAVNPQDMIDAMHAEFRRREELYYEILHNLVIELTRLGIEVHNLRMHVESVSSRLDFDERRGRALESVVQYRSSTSGTAGAPGTPGPSMPGTSGVSGTPATSGMPSISNTPSAPGTPLVPGAPNQMGARPEGGRRRRRRRRRRGSGGGPNGPGTPGTSGTPGASGAPGTSGTPGSGPADVDAGDFDDAGDGDGAPDQ